MDLHRPARLLVAVATFAAASLVLTLPPDPVRALGTHSTTVALQVHDVGHGVVTSSPAGAPVHVRVLVFPDLKTDPTPTGTVTVFRWTNGTCASNSLTGVSAPLGADGTVDMTNLSWTPQDVTPGSFRARYNGDAVFDQKFSPCQPLTVTQAIPTLVTTVHDEGGSEVVVIEEGHPVLLRFTVSGSIGVPSGNVIVRVFHRATCSGEPEREQGGPLPLTGVFDASFTLPVGAYVAWGHYFGSTNYDDGNSNCAPFSVKARSGITERLTDALGATSSQFIVGSIVRDEIRVTGAHAEPTGSVRFQLYANSTCLGTPTSMPSAPLNSGKVVFDQTTTAPGSFSIRPRYLGDATYFPVSGDCQPYTVIPAPTLAPTQAPTSAPTSVPTSAPTSAPTMRPTISPSNGPTVSPSHAPAPTAAASSPTPPPASGPLLASVAPGASSSPSQPGTPTASVLPQPAASGSPSVPGATGQPPGQSPGGAPGGSPASGAPTAQGDAGASPVVVAMAIALVALVLGAAMWFRRRRPASAGG